MSDESSEFYAHGQVQVRFLSRRVKRVVSLFLLLLAFALICTAMMVDYRKSIKNKKYNNSTNKRRFILMNVFIGFEGTLLVYLIAGLCYTPYGWIELSPMLRPFAIFGQRKHIVPHVSQVLNFSRTRLSSNTDILLLASNHFPRTEPSPFLRQRDACNVSRKKT